MENNIYLGDCLEVMKDIGDKTIDLIFCDMPYGTTKNKWDTIIPLPQLWEHYERIIKDKGCICLTAQSPFDKVLGCSNMKLFRYEWIWVKNKSTGFLNSKRMPLKTHENILIFYKRLPTYNPQKTFNNKPMNAVRKTDKIVSTDNYNEFKRTGCEGGDTSRYPKDVINIPVINNDNPLKYHPTQKPIELPEYFIKTYTNEGDLVLDNCFGSGSTIKACIKLKRKYIGIEIDEEYYNKLDAVINT